MTKKVTVPYKPIVQICEDHSYRLNIMIGDLILKVPVLSAPMKGLESNRFEWGMWEDLRESFYREYIAKVYFSDPLGLILIQERPDRVLTAQALDSNPRYRKSVQRLLRKLFTYTRDVPGVYEVLTGYFDNELKVVELTKLKGL